MPLDRVFQNKLNIFLSKVMERAVFLKLEKRGLKMHPGWGEMGYKKWDIKNFTSVLTGPQTKERSFSLRTEK